MTKVDEEVFCNALRSEFLNVYFFDVGASKDRDIDKKLFKSITESDSLFFSIVNFNLIDKDVLKNRYEIYGGYYHFGCTGIGQMQYLRCQIDSNNNLQIGRIAGYLNKENEQDYKYEKMVYKILKN